MRRPSPKLIGTYTPPAVKKGERVSCLFRDCDCTVTSWSDAPISWPRVQPREQRGGCGLWVNDTLVRAIRTESAEALMYWFGVSANVVWRWRKAFGVSGTATTPGTRKAHRQACRAGAEGMRAKEWTDKELDDKADLAKRLGKRPGPRWTPATGGWTPAQLALLGTDHDTAIACKLRRSLAAVRKKRVRLKIPAFSGNSGGGRGWTAKELKLLGTDDDEVIAKKIGRTLRSEEQAVCVADPRVPGPPTGRVWSPDESTRTDSLFAGGGTRSVKIACRPLDPALAGQIEARRRAGRTRGNPQSDVRPPFAQIPSEVALHVRTPHRRHRPRRSAIRQRRAGRRSAEVRATGRGTEQSRRVLSAVCGRTRHW